MKYPSDCVTIGDKLEYCYALEERLRRLHNQVGAWRRGELTKEEYLKLPSRVKARLPEWKPQLTREEWRRFVADVFEPVYERVVWGEINALREQAKRGARWRPEVEDVVDGS